MRDFFAGFERPWWVVGGWAIEAFTFEHGTGAPREHEDIDVSILVSDVPALRSHVGESWQLWNIADGAMRPLTDLWPDVQHPESQIWGRRGAGSAATSNRTWPLMDDRAREWLREKVTLLHPGHAWPTVPGEGTVPSPLTSEWRTIRPGRTTMNRRPLVGRLLPAVALSCVLFGLVGCGQATQTPETTSADDVGGGVSGSTGGDTPVSSDPSPSLAQWPAVGCDSRSVVSVDYGRMPTGFDTPEEAVENSPAVGLPDGVLTMAPYSGKGAAQVWIVDPETDEIQAQVSVFRGPDGWFVDGVMTCS